MAGKDLQDLTDEALADLLKKHRHPVGLKAALQLSHQGCREASQQRSPHASRYRFGRSGLDDLRGT
jgi:hypothetical protein